MSIFLSTFGGMSPDGMGLGMEYVGWYMVIPWYQKGRPFKILKKHQRPQKKILFEELSSVEVPRVNLTLQPCLAGFENFTSRMKPCSSVARHHILHLYRCQMTSTGQSWVAGTAQLLSKMENSPVLSCAETRGVCFLVSCRHLMGPPVQVANVPPSSPRRLLDYSPGSKKLKPPDRSPRGRQQITQQRGPEWSWTVWERSLATTMELPELHHLYWFQVTSKARVSYQESSTHRTSP